MTMSETPWTVLQLQGQSAPSAHRGSASFAGDPVERALTRASLVSGPDRILLSTPQSALSRLRTAAFDPATRFSVHPRQSGTGPAVALSALMIERFRGAGVMALLPTHHEVSDDLRLMSHVRQAIAWVDERPDDVVLVVVRPRAPDAGRRWVVNRSGGDSPLQPVPARLAPCFGGGGAGELLARGAWWDTGVVVGSTRGLLGLVDRVYPGFVAETRDALRDGWDAVAAGFDSWPPFDLHDDVLTAAGDRLRALRARGVYVDPVARFEDPRRETFPGLAPHSRSFVAAE